MKTYEEIKCILQLVKVFNIILLSIYNNIITEYHNHGIT